jgi:hypothetical protein
MLIFTSSDIYWNSGYVDSVIHPPDLLHPSIYGFQMFKIDHGISTSGAGLSLLFDSVCCKDREIFLCDKDVSKGNHVKKFAPTSLLGQSGVCWQFSLSRVYAKFLLPVVSGRSSTWKSFGLWFWQCVMFSLSVVCVIKVIFVSKGSASSFP